MERCEAMATPKRLAAMITTPSSPGLVWHRWGKPPAPVLPLMKTHPAMDIALKKLDLIQRLMQVWDEATLQLPLWRESSPEHWRGS